MRLAPSSVGASQSQRVQCGALVDVNPHTHVRPLAMLPVLSSLYPRPGPVPARSFGRLADLMQPLMTNMAFCTQFFKTFIQTMLRQLVHVLTDRLHVSGFVKQVHWLGPERRHRRHRESWCRSSLQGRCATLL